MSLLNDAKLEDFLDALHAQSEGQTEAIDSYFRRRIAEGTLSWDGLDAETTAVIMREFSAPGGAAADANEPNLSKREREIVSLVAQGLKNREIADKMFISEQTVKNHLHNIFDKVGVSDRLELALFAVQHKIRPE